MEKEAFFSGYCRQIDGSRTVAAVAENSELTEVDCCFETCIHARDCTIGKNIAELLKSDA